MVGAAQLRGGEGGRCAVTRVDGLRHQAAVVGRKEGVAGAGLRTVGEEAESHARSSLFMILSPLFLSISLGSGPPIRGKEGSWVSFFMITPFVYDHAFCL